MNKLIAGKKYWICLKKCNCVTFAPSIQRVYEKFGTKPLLAEAYKSLGVMLFRYIDKRLIGDSIYELKGWVSSRFDINEVEGLQLEFDFT